jgi:hypothetical protein
VFSAMDPYGRIMDFLDRSSYFFFQVTPKGLCIGFHRLHLSARFVALISISISIIMSWINLAVVNDVGYPVIGVSYF